MTKLLDIHLFLSHTAPLLDVRSPSEFTQGHIPGAVSFPLFTNEERAEVGTLYKRLGKEAAVKLGLKFVGPKLSSFIEIAESLAIPNKRFRLYCWRGGMRSSSLAWLLETAGFECFVLEGGYKIFRRWALEQFTKTYSFLVLGGLTGSGKTDLLHHLEKLHEQIIDLEKLARHSGSSFGHLGHPKQPSTEHFENGLAYHLSLLDINTPIWIEDESRMIGTCHIPEGIWTQMRHARLLWIECSKEERIERLLQAYGNHAPNSLIRATERLSKKLGEVRMKQAVQHIQNCDLEKALSVILDYYDQAYLYSCKRREKIFT